MTATCGALVEAGASSGAALMRSALWRRWTRGGAKADTAPTARSVVNIACGIVHAEFCAIARAATTWPREEGCGHVTELDKAVAIMNGGLGSDSRSPRQRARVERARSGEAYIPRRGGVVRRKTFAEPGRCAAVHGARASRAARSPSPVLCDSRAWCPSINKSTHPTGPGPSSRCVGSIPRARTSRPWTTTPRRRRAQPASHRRSSAERSRPQRPMCTA